MSWTAVVPLKAPGDRKTRLARACTADERTLLSDAMAEHVIATLRGVPSVSRVLMLSPSPANTFGAEWAPDFGTGLNAELQRLRTVCTDRMLVLHADLPLLACEDVAALLAAAEAEGMAIAPDRHDRGTNGLALRDAHPFRFAFGTDSFAAHRLQRPGSVVRRAGLGLDVDTSRDLAAIRSLMGEIPWFAQAPQDVPA